MIELRTRERSKMADKITESVAVDKNYNGGGGETEKKKKNVGVEIDAKEVIPTKKKEIVDQESKNDGVKKKTTKKVSAGNGKKKTKKKKKKIIVISTTSSTDGTAVVATTDGGTKGCRVQVSNNKKPLFYYLNVAKKYIKHNNYVELSALGMAIPTVVTISEILKKDGWVTEKKIGTSTVTLKDETKGRNIMKAKIEILLERCKGIVKKEEIKIDGTLTENNIDMKLTDQGKEANLSVQNVTCGGCNGEIADKENSDVAPATAVTGN